MNKKAKLPTVSAADLADLLGLSERHVGRLAASGVIPPPIRGKFALRDSVRGYVSSLYARTDSGPLREARRRRTLAQSSLDELTLAERRGRLVDLGDLMKRLEPIY